jgi:MFS family permease
MTTSETIEGRPNEALTMTTRQRLILIPLLGANFMLSADFSILNVALPKVGKAVGLGVDDLPWVTTTFALPSAGLSLLFGRLGDLTGVGASFLLAYCYSRWRRFSAAFQLVRLSF